MKKILVLFLLIFGVAFAETQYIAKGIYTNEGRLLDGENLSIKHPLNSITKLMSSLVVADSIGQGKITFDTMVTINEAESKLDGIKMQIKKGDNLSVRDLLLGLLLGNQNNATIALTRVVAGSEDEFVKLMNEKAKSLGMKNTTFYTATGLHPDISKKKSDIGTVEDVIKLLNAVMSNKVLNEMIKSDSLNIKNNTLKISNVNKIVSKDTEAFGIRLGSHSTSGHNIIFATKKEGKTYYVIILGLMTSVNIGNQINEEIDSLRNNFKTTILINTGEFIIEAPLKNGKVKRIELFAAKDIVEEVKSQWKLNKYVFLPKEIKAPIKKGEKVGTYIISYEGREIGRTDLVTNEDIKESNFLDEIRKKFTN